MSTRYQVTGKRLVGDITTSSLDRYQVKEVSPVPVVKFLASSKGHLEDARFRYHQWSCRVGAATDDEGRGFSGAGHDDGGYIIREKGQQNITLKIPFTLPAPAAGTITFTASGVPARTGIAAAVAGVHYSVASTTINVAAGDTEAELVVTPIDGSKWFKERGLQLKITACSFGAIDLEEDEYRLYLHPTVDPPSIVFSAASASGGAGAYSVNVTASAASLEDIKVYYQTAVGSGLDHTITGGDESGSLTIAAGATSAALGYNITSGDTGTLTFTLEHPTNTVYNDTHGEELRREDENGWHWSSNWHGETDHLFPPNGPGGVADPRLWPGDPSIHNVSGLKSPSSAHGGKLMDRDNLGVIDTDSIVTLPATTPSGEAPQGLVIVDHYATDPDQVMLDSGVSYIRESFEDQYECGGPVTLNPLPEYNLISCCWGEFSGDDAWRKARFLKMTFRVRSVDRNHTITIDTDPDQTTPLNSQGEPCPSEEIYTGMVGGKKWCLWTSSLIDPTYTTFGCIKQTFSGEGSTKASGVEVNRVWMLHKLGGTHNGAEEKLGESLGNMILRPTWVQAENAAGTDDGSGEKWLSDGGPGSPRTAVGYGFPVFWPWYQGFTSAPSTPPTKFWHKHARLWEPRGCASLTAGQVHAYTHTSS